MYALFCVFVQEKKGLFTNSSWSFSFVFWCERLSEWTHCFAQKVWTINSKQSAASLSLSVVNCILWPKRFVNFRSSILGMMIFLPTRCVRCGRWALLFALLVKCFSFDFGWKYAYNVRSHKWESSSRSEEWKKGKKVVRKYVSKFGILSYFLFTSHNRWRLPLNSLASFFPFFSCFDHLIICRWLKNKSLIS